MKNYRILTPKEDAPIKKVRPYSQMDISQAGIDCTDQNELSIMYNDSSSIALGREFSADSFLKTVQQDTPNLNEQDASFRTQFLAALYRRGFDPFSPDDKIGYIVEVAPK